jgi:hypothetical protein
MIETKHKPRFVYAVMVPEDTGLDSVYGRASDAIARLKEYGPVPDRASRDLRSVGIVYVLPSEGYAHPETHAVRLRVLK